MYSNHSDVIIPRHYDQTPLKEKFPAIKQEEPSEKHKEAYHKKEYHPKEANKNPQDYCNIPSTKCKNTQNMASRTDLP